MVDAKEIPQPDYSDLWNSYVAGATSAKNHPNVTPLIIRKSADAWCKKVLFDKSPEVFISMGD